MLSGSVNWERWSRAGGIGFVILAIVGFVVTGEPPKINDTPEEYLAFFDGDRGQILFGTVLFGLALVLFGWFIGALVNLLRDSGEPRLGATAGVMGAAFMSGQIASTAIFGGLALNVAAGGDGSLVKALSTMSWSIDNFAAFPAAGFVAVVAVGLARANVLAKWTGMVGIVGSILVLLHGTNWATSGFWAPAGGYTIITIVVFLAWTLMISVLLFRTAVPAGAPRASGSEAMGGAAAG